ncbi:MAG: zinc ribbon domain-containing protein [Promethearchaeota archaeon]
MTEFLNVSVQNGQLVPLGYEKIETTIDDVKFEGNSGNLAVSDIRIVWYKLEKQKGGGLLGGFAKAFAVGVAGSVAAGAARRHGGFAGRAIGRGISHATHATATAIVLDTISTNQMVARGKGGVAESLAVPLMVIDNIDSPQNKLVITLTSGEDIQFESKKPQMFAVIEAQIEAAKVKNKCPFCGSSIPAGDTHCPHCAAPVTSGAPSSPSPAPPVTGPAMMPGGMPAIPQVQCPHCHKTVPISERCTQCGKELIVHCSKCDSEYPLFMFQGNFCPKCGNKIR